VNRDCMRTSLQEHQFVDGFVLHGLCCAALLWHATAAGWASYAPQASYALLACPFSVCVLLTAWLLGRLQLAPLGRLEKLLIGHNGLGDSPSWHLLLVEVVEEANGRVTYFAADRWELHCDVRFHS
jgi:hypothetical protein